MVHRIFIAALFLLSCGKSSTNSNTKSEEEEGQPYVSPYAETYAQEDSSPQESYAQVNSYDSGYGDATASSENWCLYGPGVFGGIYFKGKYSIRQECLDSRTFRDYCDPC